jgi:hypothetical protein
MKKIGTALLVFGIISLIAVLSMDTSVPTDSFSRVNNLGLMQEKQNFMMLSGLIVLVGAMLMGFGLKTSRAEQTGQGAKVLSIFIYLVAAGIGARFIYTLTPIYQEEKSAHEQEVLKIEKSLEEDQRQTERMLRESEERLRDINRLKDRLGISRP